MYRGVGLIYVLYNIIPHTQFCANL